MNFFKSDHQGYQFNSRLLKDDNIWLFYGEGYRLASELLEKHVLEVDSSYQDFLIYPYCYLIRHYIEIRLKEIIDEVNKLIEKPIDPSKGGHDLTILWRNAQDALKIFWKDQHSDAPRQVSNFINELHRIDLKSECFRYPVDKKGNGTLLGIKVINFRKLAIAFKDVKYFLDGVTDGLAVAKEDKDNYL